MAYAGTEAHSIHCTRLSNDFGQILKIRRSLEGKLIRIAMMA